MELVEGVATVDDLDAFVARIGAIGDDHGVSIQAFDARYVVDRTHLERGVALADRAIERGENVARERSVEILCYVAGTRQIDRALAVGVSEGECPAVVLVDGEDDAAESASVAAVRDIDGPARIETAETLGDFDPDFVREAFDVGDAELDAVAGTLADVVHERVALLDVEK